MKIQSTSAQNAQAAYRNASQPTQEVAQGQTSSGTAAAKLQRADMAVISPQGKRQALALSAVQTASDVDEATVTKLRGEVKNGTYNVDEQNLASQLLKPSGIA